MFDKIVIMKVNNIKLMRCRESYDSDFKSQPKGLPLSYGK